MHQLNNLEHQTENKEQSLEVVAQQLEGVFLELVLKSMREAEEHLKSDMFSSNAQDMYQDMYDKQLSLSLSQMKSVGLKEIIVKQMSHQQNAQLDGKQEA